MSTQTRTPEEIYAEIQRLVESPFPETGSGRAERLRQEAALWGEIGRDLTIPLWAAIAAGRARLDCEERAHEAALRAQRIGN